MVSLSNCNLAEHLSLYGADGAMNGTFRVANKCQVWIGYYRKVALLEYREN